MKKIHKIIVPIDFLEHTDQIVEYAEYIAKSMSANLHFIHVVEPPHIYAGYEYPSLDAFGNEMTAQADKLMQLLVDNNRDKFPECTGKVFRGNIVDSIIKYTKDEKGDLIILGTHGRKGLGKLWLGSVAERIIKQAPCPTLSCNPYKQRS